MAAGTGTPTGGSGGCVAVATPPAEVGATDGSASGVVVEVAAAMPVAAAAAAPVPAPQGGEANAGSLPPPSATGSFASDPVCHLSALLSIPDEASRRAAVIQEVSEEATRLAGDRERGAALAEEFAKALERSSSACRRAAMLYAGHGDLAISFNGGKDACVVLYLYLACLASASSSSSPSQDPAGTAAVSSTPMMSPSSSSSAVSAAAAEKDVTAFENQTIIFFDSDKEFPAVREFVAWVIRSLGLRILSIASSNFKQGMADLVSSGLRSVVMGQRRGDPWTEHVDMFSPSSEGWPAFMRINPVIDWSYTHVWLFLRAFILPYCSMYDEGYTSIGSIGDTEKNPALLRPDGSFGPAFELRDGSTERAGRAARGSSGSTAKPSRGSEGAPEADGGEFKRSISVGCSPCLRAFKGAFGEEPRVRTAGLAIIGNELLTGKVHDSNAHYLCGQLHTRGVVVKYAEVLPDDVDAIARCVRRMSSRCDYVFTSGGLGPTHDDKTMAAVATAFDQELVEDARFLAMLSSGAARSSGERQPMSSEPASSSAAASVEASHRKMASVPRGAMVEWPEDGNPWPTVSMRNVHVLAGAPATLRAMFERTARDGRFDGPRHWLGSSLWLDIEEEDVAEALRLVVEACPGVEVGSYPATGTSPASPSDGSERRRRLNVVLECFEAEALASARARLLAALPGGALVAEEPLSGSTGAAAAATVGPLHGFSLESG